jgi:hypothetical protein
MLTNFEILPPLDIAAQKCQPIGIDELTVAYLQSIGFTVVLGSRVTGTILINGVSFYVSFAKTSFLGMNAFNKIYKPRKERYVSFHEYHGADATFRLYINTPTSLDKLRAKIEKVVSERVSKQNHLAEREKLRKEALNALFDKYSVIDGFSSLILKKGVITLSLKGGSITISPEGVITDMYFEQPSIKSLLDLKLASHNLSVLKNRIEAYCKQVASIGVVDYSKDVSGSIYTNSEGSVVVS